MKKTKVVTSKKLFCIYDKVAADYLTQYSAYCRSSGEYIRSVLNLVISNYPLPDIEVRELRTVDGSDYVVYAWDTYKYPESVAENLAPLGMSEEQVKTLFDKKHDETAKEFKGETPNV